MPAKRTKKPPSPDATPSVHERLSGAKDVLEVGGIEFPGVGTLFMVWKKLGIKGLLFVILFVGFPTGEYSALRYAVYSGLPRTVGGFGLTFAAEEWTLSPLQLRATARNVRVSEPSSGRPVLTAAEIEFQGSAWTMLRGLPDMLTFHVFGGTQPFNEVIVRHGELHLERSLTGRLNWSDFVEAVPAARFDEALDGVYRVRELKLEDFRVSYVEHLPGGSGDGIIRTAQAQVKLDEVNGTLSDLTPPDSAGARPTRFTLKGRSASGLFEVAGSAALFQPEGGARESESDERLVSMSGRSTAAAYPFEISVYLENIAAAAYGQMVPVSTIIPVNGVINGRTTIVYESATPQCKGSFAMTDVRFAPNPAVVTRPSDVEVIRRLVSNVVYSGPFEPCTAPMVGQGDDRPGRPAAEALTRLTVQATASASPGVKAIVERDRRIMGGEPVDTTLAAFTASLAQQMGMRLVSSVAGARGEAVAQSLASSGSSTNSGNKGGGNAVVGGVKAVGSGIKRLFGGGSRR